MVGVVRISDKQENGKNPRKTGKNNRNQKENFLFKYLSKTLQFK